MGKLTEQFSNEEIQMANKHMKKYSTSLTIKGMQMKTTLKSHPTPASMGIIRKQ
jgi:hypothetical protein